MDTNELKAITKMLTYMADTLSAMLEDDTEPPAAAEKPAVDWSKPIQTRADGSAEVVGSRFDLKQVKLCDTKGSVHIFEYDHKGWWTARGDHDLDIINVPEPPPLDLTKPVQTRDGRRVRILCTDRLNETYTVIGLIRNVNNDEVRSWTASGKYYDGASCDGGMDLVNVPKEQL